MPGVNCISGLPSKSSIKLARLMSVQRFPAESGFRRDKRHGFALVELLVIIVALGLLAAILFPLQARSRVKARSAQCAGNLRQLAMAQALYARDCGRSFPYTADQNLWLGMLISYQGKVEESRVCPEANQPSTRSVYSSQYTYGSGDSMWKWASQRTNYQGSYAFNGWLYSGDYLVSGLPNNPAWKYPRESSVAQPVKTPLFGDAMWVDGWPQEIEGPARDLYNGNANTSMGRWTIARHMISSPMHAPTGISSSSSLPGGINLAFMDGHASQVSLSNLWSFNWHQGWVSPARLPDPQ